MTNHKKTQSSKNEKTLFSVTFRLMETLLFILVGEIGFAAKSPDIFIRASQELDPSQSRSKTHNSSS